MGVDPPTGCNILALRPPPVTLETIKYQFSSFQSAVASGWHALHKIHFAPRIPPNSSLSRQSLAYVHASTRYIKQVSKVLKAGVTTLRSSPSSYEVVQGNDLYLKIMLLNMPVQSILVQLVFHIELNAICIVSISY